MDFTHLSHVWLLLIRLAEMPFLDNPRHEFGQPEQPLLNEVVWDKLSLPQSWVLLAQIQILRLEIQSEPCCLMEFDLILFLTKNGPTETNSHGKELHILSIQWMHVRQTAAKNYFKARDPAAACCESTQATTSEGTGWNAKAGDLLGRFLEEIVLEGWEGNLGFPTSPGFSHFSCSTKVKLLLRKGKLSVKTSNEAQSSLDVSSNTSTVKAFGAHTTQFPLSWGSQFKI